MRLLLCDGVQCSVVFNLLWLSYVPLICGVCSVRDVFGLFCGVLVVFVVCIGCVVVVVWL